MNHPSIINRSYISNEDYNKRSLNNKLQEALRKCTKPTKRLSFTFPIIYDDVDQNRLSSCIRSHLSSGYTLIGATLGRKLNPENMPVKSMCTCHVSCTNGSYVVDFIESVHNRIRKFIKKIKYDLSRGYNDNYKFTIKISDCTSGIKERLTSIIASENYDLSRNYVEGLTSTRIRPQLKCEWNTIENNTELILTISK